MNKTIKLSLVAFMLLSANVVSAQTQLTNDTTILANASETINGNKTILSDTYTTPTDINHTGGVINLGKKGELHNISDVNVSSSFKDAKYWIYGDVYLNNVSFKKPSDGNTVHSLIIENGSNLTMLGGSLDNIAINLGSSTAGYQDSIIFDNIEFNNVKYGYNTPRTAYFTILNSKVNNSDFKYETIFMTSALSGNITGGSLIIQENSKILGSIQASNLNISNSIVDGTANNSLDISNNIILDNTIINGTNVILKDNASIAIENNSLVNSEIIFGANNTLTIDSSSYQSKNDLSLANLNLLSSTLDNNLTIANSINLDNSTLNGSNVTLEDNASITIKNNSIVNSEIIFGVNNNLTIDNSSYEIKKDLNLKNLTLKSVKVDKNITVSENTELDKTVLDGILNTKTLTANETIFNSNSNIAWSVNINNSELYGDLIANKIDITNSQIMGKDNKTLQFQARNNHITFDNVTTNNTNIKIAKDKFLILKGVNTLNNINVTNDLALSANKHQIVITNNSNTTINDSIINNSSINQNSSTEFNGKLVINNSEITDTNIGAIFNNDLYTRIPTLELNNVNYVNNLANSGIYARDIIINGGYIKANELYGTDTEIMPEGINDTYTRNHTSVTIKNNAVIDSKLDSEKLIIENSTINGDLHAIKNIDLTGAKIIGDINADDLNVANTDINSSLINIANNATINNTQSNKVIGNFNIGNDFAISSANIQGSFKVGNNLTLTNSAITGDIEEVKNLNLNDSSITTNKIVSASNDITITNTTKQTSSANFSAGNNFTSTNTEFSGNITTNNLLSDNNSTFKGEVVADSINAVGSTFENTLTITGNSKNNILDNATLNQGISIDSKDASINIVNGSNIKGAIKNEGTIIVDKNSNISHEVSGSGKLNTDSATYNDNVSMGSIEGSGNTFIKDVEVTNKDSVLNVGDNTFGGNIKVENGTIMADSSFNLKDLTASNINIKNEDINTKDKISTNNVSVSDKLLIENIDVKANQISAKQAEIVNSNVTSKIFLKGNDDKATSVYDKAEITSGNYTINNSAIKGGIRVDSLSVNNSNIVGQLAVNKLNATNSTFYITGGGYNTSLYEHFSGAIIAKEGASGGNNTINISNTNIGKLINGYVPVAIINNKAPNASRADMLVASPKIVEQEFFKVTYTTPISTIFLSPSVVHYNKIDDGTSIKEIWSVGLAGKELSESEVIDIINGKGNANYSTTQAVDKNYKDYIMSEVFDNATKKELNSIIYNPYFIAKNNLDILNDRYTYLRTDNKNHGFWLDNNYSYNFYNDIKLKNKGISVGVDNFIDLDKLSVSYGAFTNTSRLSLDNAKIDTKLIGAYASTNFYNGVFIDYSLAYASLKHKFDAKKLEFNNTYYTNLWQASIKTGHRLGTTSYIEPSLEINATRFQKHNVKTKNVQITANQGTLVSLKTGVKAGVDLNKNFSLKTELAYYNDLNKSPKANVVSMLESDFSGIRDYGLNAKLGLLVKPSNKLDINADIAKKISLTNESNYKVNLGFNYKF
ncbi:autotransporter outer membrane beta-barrel domain-containing protein [Campylobacter sp. Cr9]|uniref:autotransporter outer membrane beta-barrel domain-containing protein n=1 Tax=Campylobacter sp. Cr9 TaxID=2735728 RepID=UPI0030142866|nr:autotransporter outer membrane beta-barrel domain-containing protein [Campylobacter sp. Cr9]